jgi:hypothetical protein
MKIRKTRKRNKNNKVKRFIGGVGKNYSIADRIVAMHILEQYHYGNLIQDVSKLVPILKSSEKNMVVWRGIKNPIKENLEFINHLEKNGFVSITRLTSTGATPEVAVNFCGSIQRDIMCTIFKINLLEGLPFIDVNDSLRSTRLTFPGEKEYLLLPEIEGKKLIFELVNKTITPDETNPNTLVIQKAILENEKEGQNMYWYQHPSRLLKRLEKRFVIYELNAKYI